MRPYIQTISSFAQETGAKLSRVLLVDHALSKSRTRHLKKDARFYTSFFSKFLPHFKDLSQDNKMIQIEKEKRSSQSSSLTSDLGPETEVTFSQSIQSEIEEISPLIGGGNIISERRYSFFDALKKDIDQAQQVLQRAECRLQWSCYSSPPPDPPQEALDLSLMLVDWRALSIWNCHSPLASTDSSNRLDQIMSSPQDVLPVSLRLRLFQKVLALSQSHKAEGERKLDDLPLVIIDDRVDLLENLQNQDDVFLQLTKQLLKILHEHPEVGLRQNGEYLWKVSFK